jgi:serine/threonine protein kinase
MGPLKSPVQFETALDTYTVNELLGEGGAGRVYGGHASDGTRVAVKLLAKDKINADRRRRFKNEIAFLARNNRRAGARRTEPLIFSAFCYSLPRLAASPSGRSPNRGGAFGPLDFRCSLTRGE